MKWTRYGRTYSGLLLMMMSRRVWRWIINLVEFTLLCQWDHSGRVSFYFRSDKKFAKYMNLIDRNWMYEFGIVDWHVRKLRPMRVSVGWFQFFRLSTADPALSYSKPFAIAPEKNQFELKIYAKSNNWFAKWYRFCASAFRAVGPFGG